MTLAEIAEIVLQVGTNTNGAGGDLDLHVVGDQLELHFAWRLSGNFVSYVVGPKDWMHGPGGTCWKDGRPIPPNTWTPMHLKAIRIVALLCDPLTCLALASGQVLELP